MGKIRRYFQYSKNWVYVLVHLVMLLGGFLLYELSTQSPFWLAVATSLIAAGVTGWIVFAYVLVSESVGEKLQALTSYGIEQIFDSRSVVIRNEYTQRLTRVRANIDVLGFGLSALREDFRAEFPNWKQRAAVRVLLLDPEFPTIEGSYVSQRDAEEGNPVGKIRQDVLKFVHDVGCLIDTTDAKHRFEIRLYRALPTVNIFRIDDELFWGPYFIGDQSRNMPTFLVKRGGKFFDRLVDHFDRIWRDERYSRPVPEEWLQSSEK